MEFTLDDEQRALQDTARSFLAEHAPGAYVRSMLDDDRGDPDGPGITDELWQDDLDLKLFAAIRTCRLVLDGMKERRWGRIINVLNIGAKAPRAGGAPTAVSRAAGMALTKILAGEYAQHNVLINAMLVGQIVSDQWVRRHASQGANIPFEEFTAKQGTNIPLGRMGTAEEFANIACFLASDQAGFITGTATNVDGGLSPVV